MPTYTFYDKKTKQEYDEFMSMDDREEYLKNNSHIIQVPVAVALTGDHIMGVGPKVDDGFNERMEQISNSNPGSPLAERYGAHTKTTKEIKTREVLRKHKVV